MWPRGCRDGPLWPHVCAAETEQSVGAATVKQKSPNLPLMSLSKRGMGQVLALSGTGELASSGLVGNRIYSLS